MENWNDFYKNRINSSYQLYFEEKYAVFLQEIEKLNPPRIIEAGCGIGSVSKYFARHGKPCVGFDLDIEVVKLAIKNVPGASFMIGDIFEIGTIDEELIVTHGVLEHFEDAKIEQALRFYPNSVHYVPLDKYKVPSYGDERLMSPQFWKDTFNIKNAVVFNDGLDMVFQSNY